MPYMGQYEYVIDATHPRADSNGRVYEHIKLIEQKIGRFLCPEEVVHHIDEDKLNNIPDNLLLFINRAEHMRFHHYACNKDILELTESGAYKCSIIFNHSVCPSCGKIKDKHSQLCFNCFNLFKNRKVLNRPSREELKKLIRNNSFVAIGKIYSVTDNAIRKWCKGYNLSYLKTKIQLMSEETWNTI